MKTYEAAMILRSMISSTTNKDQLNCLRPVAIEICEIMQDASDPVKKHTVIPDNIEETIIDFADSIQCSEYGFDVLKKLYAECGAEIFEVRGNTRARRTMIALPFDGVQYTIDSHIATKVNRPLCSDVIASPLKYLMPELRNLEMMVSRHHDLIKAAYEYTKDKTGGDIWVLSGGGSELQAFFGNETGYLGILYLSSKLQDIVDENIVYKLVPEKKGTNLFDDLQNSNIEIDKIWDNVDIPEIN